MIVYFKPHISIIIFNLRFLQLFTCFVRLNNDITLVRSSITLTVQCSVGEYDVLLKILLVYPVKSFPDP